MGLKTAAPSRSAFESVVHSVWSCASFWRLFWLRTLGPKNQLIFPLHYRNLRFDVARVY
jgi:hypothetical protein